MDTITRTKDLLSGQEDLQTIYCIKDFPVFMGTTSNPIEDDLFMDMEFAISKTSGLVQLRTIPSSDLVYMASHGPGAVGNTWKQHHADFASFVTKFNPKSVLEIGGYSGILAKNCLENNDIDWTIVDPHNLAFDDLNVKSIQSFFEAHEYNQKYGSVVHSHLFEHILDYDLFLNKCNDVLEDDGLMIFSFPNFKKIIDLRQTNSIQFEHTVLLDEFFVDLFLSKYGFGLVEKQVYDPCNSIFYCVKKISKKSIDFDQNSFDHYKKYLINYFLSIEKFVSHVNKQIQDNENVFIFGGHVTTQYLLCLGVGSNKIINVLDNNPDKHDKRLYGTNLYVKNPDIIKEYKNPIVILKNSAFDNEIKTQLLSINPNVTVITHDIVNM